MEGSLSDLLVLALSKVLGSSAMDTSPNATSFHQNMGSPNATSTSTSPSSSLPISGFFASLLSIPGLLDYAKLLLMGSVIPFIQQAFAWAQARAISTLFLTACFQEEDPAYDWMMVWLAQHPAWRRARDVEVSTRTVPDGSSPRYCFDDDGTDSSSRKFSYLPSPKNEHWMWYKGRYVSVCRSKDSTGLWGRQEETLVIRILTWDHTLLNELLCEARAKYKSAQSGQIGIYASDGDNDWRHIASRPKRPLKSIVLEPGVKEDLLEDAQEFLESKEWYNDRGIPFRRGYLLYGAPGTGKTSLIQSIAGELGLDVYILTLSRSGLDDTVLSGLIADMPEKCIAIMEDIDAAFTQGVNRDAPNPAPNPNPAPATSVEGPPQPPDQNQSSKDVASKVTLSGLLNAIDGVGAQEGRILFATTNKYHTLDAALCRPGRMDKHVEFKLASRYQARELYRKFYEQRKKPTAKAVEEERWEKDSGFEEKLVDVSSPPSPARKVKKLEGPELSAEELDGLATQFADAIMGREHSMASLQGYLMQYKTKPHDASANVAQWVQQERENREKKETSGS
ncbi:P-loop containing nucleoside triphosphate hydrolase protein [Neolentinus lepideus HHB14362 ss-1]|uniref:p-loop containing nucleoside triphosphate hydrolase protein n=1 Tax=Neolentinus lepideus HHB14362 ss-1 TaxID=1314782 RepID=A0A165PX45_9AGAM|nr:P-loop containing nucleoside triphosphate hydrolase protein [Neolentinus lepideus HHB14362 ss-1]